MNIIKINMLITLINVIHLQNLYAENTSKP